MTDNEERLREQVFHDTSAGMPVVVWGMVTAALNRKRSGVAEYQNAIADLSEDGARLMGGTSGYLVLFGKFSEVAADLLEELAAATGQDAHEIARVRGLQAAERRERWRQNRPK